MQKLFLILGCCMAFVFIMQANNGALTSEDIFLSMSGSGQSALTDVLGEKDADEIIVNEEVAVAEGYVKIAADKKYDTYGSRVPFANHVYGVVMSVEDDVIQDISSFFSRLARTQTVGSFVIIDNFNQSGEEMIVSSKYGFETPYGKVEPNIDLLRDLDVDLIDGNKLSEAEDLKALIPFLEQNFPKANVTPLLVNQGMLIKDGVALATNIAKEIDENVVVIILNKGAESLDDASNQFHEELNESVIKSLDYLGTEQMDVQNKAVYVLGLKIFKDIGAGKFLKAGSPMVVYEGEPTERDLTILAFGDIMLGRFVRTLMDQNGMDYIFEKIKGEQGLFFEGADVIFGNLEGPILGAGKSGGTAMNFAFNEDVGPFLVKHGFNLVSLSNNHALDQGWEGYERSKQVLDEAGMGWCGHPELADPDSVYYGSLKDKRYAFVCFQDVTHKLDDAAAVELIKSVRPNVDYLVVSIHWGYEYKHSADYAMQEEPARAFVDAGADLILGHHPHVVQNFEIYKNKLIFYSLGNFVFDQYWSTETQEELAVGVVLDDENGKLKTKAYLFPMKSARSQSYLLEGAERERLLEEFTTYGSYSEEVKNMIRRGVIETRES